MMLINSVETLFLKPARALAAVGVGVTLITGTGGLQAADAESPKKAAKEAAKPKHQKAKVGDPAASLDGLKFIKGTPLSIEKGKVYIVEFWATWCGPCVKNIPHLTKLQEKYKDKGVTVIGVTTEGNVAKVKGFVTKQGKKMDYTVAVDADRKVHAGYMRAYEQRYIPCAFLVDRQGTLVWVGQPSRGMDEVLEMLVDGTFDLKAYTKAQEEKRAISKAAGEITKEYFKALRDGASIEKSRQIAEKLFKLESPDALAGLVWDIADTEGSDKIKCDYEFALKLAKKANEDTGGKNPSMLDTYADMLAKTGNLKQAIKVEKKALSLETDNEKMRKYLQKQLAQYKKELAELEK